jgi:hypothetical protein
MPVVKGKHYPYTAAGKKSAAKARKKYAKGSEDEDNGSSLEGKATTPVRADSWKFAFNDLIRENPAARLPVRLVNKLREMIAEGDKTGAEAAAKRLRAAGVAAGTAGLTGQAGRKGSRKPVKQVDKEREDKKKGGPVRKKYNTGGPVRKKYNKGRIVRGPNS